MDPGWRRSQQRFLYKGGTYMWRSFDDRGVGPADPGEQSIIGHTKLEGIPLSGGEGERTRSSAAVRMATRSSIQSGALLISVLV